MHSGGPSRAAFVVRSTVDNLRAVGVDVDQVLARVGLDLASYGIHGRVPISLVRTLWDEAERVSGNDMLGVEVGRRVVPAQFDVIGQVMRTSATLAEAIARGQRYLPLVTDAHHFELRVEGDEARLRLQCDEAEHPQVVECLLATFGMLGRAITGKPLTPRAVRVRHREPARAERLRAEFGPHLFFDADADELVFDRAFLALPVVGYDAALCEILERHAQQMLEESSPAPGVVRSVREAVAVALRGHAPSCAEVAARLAMSERTLRRKLVEHGTSYRELLDAARRDLALRYLRATDLDVSEIGFLLGFANVGAFGRAFRRWVGASPVEYRRKHS